MVKDISRRGADYVGKILLIGRGRVGKTAFATRFVDDKFQDEYKMTIGVSQSVKTIPVPEHQSTVKFTLWDMAGQRRFRKLFPAYATGAQGILYFCSLQDPEEELASLTHEERQAFEGEDKDSIKEIEHWEEIIRENDISPHAQKFLIATKLDLIPEDGKSSKIEEILKQSKKVFGLGGTALMPKKEFGKKMRCSLEEKVFDFYPYEISVDEFKQLGPEDQLEVPLLRFPVYFTSSKTGHNVDRVMNDLAKQFLDYAKTRVTSF